MNWTLCALLALAVGCSAKLTVGPFYADNQQWALVDSFFFGGKGGELNIRDVELPESQGNLYLALYHDIPGEFGGFPDVYNSGWSCQKKLSIAAAKWPMNHSNFREFDETGVNGVTVVVNAIVPRKWYVVLVNCDEAPKGKEGVGLSDFTIEWTNGNTEEFNRFVGHFSMDERGIYEVMIFSLLSLLVLIGATTFLFLRLRNDETDLAHNVLGLLLVAMGIHALAVTLELAHFDAFSNDGLGLPDVRAFALVLDIAAQLVLVTMFICVGKGYVIESDSVRDLSSVIKLMVIYLLLAVILLYWSYTEQSPATDLYAFQTEAGMCIVALRVVSMLWFLSSLQRTYKREQAGFKLGFYMLVAGFGCFFFLQLPIITLIADLLPVYHMQRVTVILEQITMLMTHFMWLVLFYTNRSMFLKKTQNGMDQGSFADLSMDSMGGKEIHT